MQASDHRVPSVTAGGRYAILAAAFLGWMFSGVQMSLMPLASRSATKEFTDNGVVKPDRYLWLPNLWLFDVDAPVAAPEHDKAFAKVILSEQQPKWFSLYSSLFLLGAAAGGFAFGRLGDRAGRVRAMAASIFCFSLFAGAGYLAVTPEQLLVCRFLSGLGVGGMWPTGVSLASEVWPDVSRPLLSGLLGTSANVGITLVNAGAYFIEVTPDSWRWLMLVGMSPAILGVFVIFFVPESPAWLTARITSGGSNSGTRAELFRPPLLKRTLIGIALGTIPLLGGWGVTQWLILWTDRVSVADPHHKALTAMMRSAGGTLGSLIGGWLANRMGRRTTYFAISLVSLGLSEFIYVFMHPTMPGFDAVVFLVGGISTVFFGWLPLYLPELFPTHARATGAGISFNFGRILTAAGVLGTGALLAYFNEDYRQAGSIMSLVYALGMIVILFAPDTSQKKIGDTA